METKRRLALLIDADNAQAALIPQVIQEASKHGVLTIRRVFGDWTTTNLQSWKGILHKHALQPAQQFSYTTGKNSTDGALIIDAMDLIYSGGVDGFCIVSSDSDYTRLATRIREKNLFVMGVGRTTTPEAFVHACNAFVFTEKLCASVKVVAPKIPSPASKPENAPPPTPSLKAGIKKHFRGAFDEAAQTDGWAHLGALGSSLRKLDPAFKPAIYGHKTLSQLVQSHPAYFEVEKRASKSGIEDIYIRLKGV